MPVYMPLPEALTAPLAHPPRPPLVCTLGGAPTVCVLDALATIPAYQATLEMCNDDRRRAALLGAVDGR